LKEIKSNRLLSLGILNDPFLDRFVQYSVLYTINEIHKLYGFSRIKMDDLYTIINGYFSSSNIKIPFDTNILVKLIPGLSIYGVEVKVDEKIFSFDRFSLENKDVDLRIDEKILLDKISEVYGIYEPTLLIKELQSSQNKVKESEQLKINFLITSKLFEKKEISEKLATMINNANEHVYIMLAFYEQDMLFFSDFLLAKMLTSKIDLKVIYNPNDTKNEEFLERLMKKLGNNTDFFRAYSARYLKNPVQAFVGNLHSKAIITESELLVGSANLTVMSMYNNVETAIYTNHIESVKTANDFFELLWVKLRSPNAI
jgi:phosphatidylserine/phosphatidylglycerophosphate/cardiolipin synthase-like enzyme